MYDFLTPRPLGFQCGFLLRTKGGKTKKLLVGFLVLCCALNVARAENNCTGATYYDSDSDTCITCPTGYDYNQDAGKTDITQCQIHCNAGTYVEIPGIAGYTQLEYIESTGTQWINTGIVGNTNLTSIKHYVGFGYSQLPTNRQLSGFNGNGNNYWGVSVSGSDVVFEVYAKGTYSVQPNTMYDLYMEQHKSNGSTILDVKLDNVPVDYIRANGTRIDSSRLSMFALSGGSYKMTHARISYYKVYFDGVLVGDFIPVRRNSDGAIGMYDMVSGQFFANAGTGTFIAGNNVSQCTDVGAGYWAGASTVNYGSVGTRNACPAGTYSSITNAGVCTPCAGATYNDITAQAACKSCPPGYDYNTAPGKTDITQCQIHCDAGTWNGEYTRLEYLESTGTQYIDTDTKFMYGDEFFFEYMPIASYSGENKGYGAGSSGPVEISGGGRRVSGNVTVYMNGNRTYSPTLAYDNTLGKHYTEHWKIDSDTGVLHSVLTDVSNDLTYTLTGPTYSSSYNSGNSVLLWNGPGGSTSRIRIYRTWLKRMDGTMAFDLVPARRNTDGVLGMYDMVSGQFFTNAGTGTFIAGDDVGATGGQCVDVGAGYWAGASTVNYGSFGTRNACVAPTTTVGYGRGADEAADCGRILHIGDEVVYLRASKKTSPALHVDVDNDGIADFFGNATTADVVMHAGSIHKLKLQVGDTVYSIYDDTIVP